MGQTAGDKAQDKYAEGKPSSSAGGSMDSDEGTNDRDVTVTPNTGMTSSGSTGGGMGKTGSGDDTTVGTGSRQS